MEVSSIERLRPCRVCHGLNDAEIARVASVSIWREVRPEETVKIPGDGVSALYTITHGRLRMYRQTRLGEEEFIGYANLGETVGQQTLLSDSVEHELRIVSDARSRLAVMPRTRALRLMLEIPRFRRNVMEALGLRIESLLRGRPAQRISRVVGVVADRTTPGGRLLPIIASALSRFVPNLAVVTDRSEAYSALADSASIVALPEASQRHELIRNHITGGGRVLLDISPTEPESILGELVSETGETLWCCDNAVPNNPAEQRLTSLVENRPDLTPLIKCVQVLSPDSTVGRLAPCCSAVTRRDLMVPADALSDQPSRRGRQGIDRVVRHLQGVKLGLALGGGGARGLAHLGVLKALESEDISFDIMSGTSAGAMIGLGYVSGMSTEAMIEAYSRELRPSGLLDLLPGGRKLHLLVKFRSRGWDELLRKYYRDWQLQQLPTPFHVVATDLISGDEVISDSGDIVQAILETINVPVMSDPILRDGMMLVDGGVLNNLPVELLCDRGSHYVVGVDVSKEIPKHFAGNDSETPTEKMHSPGKFETAYRVMDVSRRGITRLQMTFADLLIEPDTSEFDFADFVEAEQIAASGEEAAARMLPELKNAYQDLMSNGEEVEDT